MLYSLSVQKYSRLKVPAAIVPRKGCSIVSLLVSAATISGPLISRIIADHERAIEPSYLYETTVIKSSKSDYPGSFLQQVAIVTAATAYSSMIQDRKFRYHIKSFT